MTACALPRPIDIGGSPYTRRQIFQVVHSEHGWDVVLNIAAAVKAVLLKCSIHLAFIENYGCDRACKGNPVA